jgi:ABC-2 type transport system permease protein
MTEFGAAVGVELLKVRRSRLPWVTVLAFTVAALFGAVIMFILQDPARARRLGLLGAKAQLSGGTADWSGYFALLAQTVAVGGALIFGLILVWLFGREFSDRTAKDLLALPTSRAAIVRAKFAVCAAWCLLLTLQVYLLGLLAGAALHLPGWSAGTAVAALGRMLATGAMAVSLVLPLGLAASVGRGYLAGVAVLVATVFTAQVVALLGYGQWFPWSVPAIYSGTAGPDQPAVGPVGFLLVVLVGTAALAATEAWWQRADQTR